MKGLESILKDLISHALECDRASITGVSGLGKHPYWDSLGHVAIIVAIEKRFGLEIQDSEIEHLLEFGQLLNYIDKNYNDE